MGSRYAGETPIPCCISKKSNLEVIAELNELKIRMPELSDPQNKKFALDDIDLALKHISECEK